MKKRLLWSAVLGATWPANADVDTDIVLDVGVRGEISGSDLDSRFQLESGRLQDVSGRVSGAGISGAYGNIAAAGEELLLSRRGFRGLNAGFGGGRLATTLLGGQVSGRSSGANNQTLYGARSTWTLNKKLALNLSGLVTPGATSEEGPWIGGLALNYQPRPDTQPGTALALENVRSRGGDGWQLTASHQTRMLTARAVVRRVDAEFSGAANPDLERKRNGYALSASARRGDLRLALGTRRFSGGSDGSDDLDRVSLSYLRRGGASLGLYWQSGEQQLRPFSPLLLDEAEGEEPREDLQATRLQNMGAQWSQRVGSTRATLGFDRTRSSLVGTSQSSQTANRLSLSLSRALGAGSNLNVLHSYLVSGSAQRNARQTGHHTQILASHRWGQARRILVGLSRENTRAHSNSSSRTRNRLIGDLGLQFPLTGETSLGLSYRAFLGGSGASIDDRLRIRLRRLFDFGPSRAAGARTAQQRRLLGAIKGQVFDDLNNNGRRDAGEPPVAGVSVALRRNSERRSDEGGIVDFADLAPQTYVLRLNTRTLPLEFAILEGSEIKTSVASQKTALVDFPVVRSGQIRGTIWQDLNRNGRRDEGETPVSDALIRVEGSEVISFSNRNGEFLLANLAPRRWKIGVDLSSLRGEFQNTTPALLEIEVTPNGTANGVLLGVAPTPREIVSSFERSQDNP